jgi:DnaJ-class molecular chaperone
MQRPRINECTRCNGTGYIGKWKHIVKGMCFECEGENGYVRSSQKKIGCVVENKERYHQEIMASIASDNSVLSGRSDLLNDSKIIDGMATLAEEGFDDEILADYAHQMSKH